MSKRLQLVNGIPRMVSINENIYDETEVIGVGGLATGSPLTLPNSQTYLDAELEVYLNNIRLEDAIDYNYVGVAPRTQVSFTFDLEENDAIRFRIE